MMYMLAGFAFGYAKPVPFRPENFRHPRRDTVLVAMAGPAANLVLAAVFLVTGLAVARLSGGAVHMSELVLGFFWAAIMLNCLLFIFNLIPIPPLDGHYVLDLFLSERARGVVRQLGIFGILIAWWLSRPIFDTVLPPIQRFVLHAFGAAWGIRKKNRTRTGVAILRVDRH